MSDNLSDILVKLEFAKVVVRAAGNYLRAHLSDELEISEKTSFSDLVTNFDRAVQKQILSKIKTRFPKDNFLAEEDDVNHDISDGNVWVIDPIDGTTNFIVQRDDFAIMVAYYEAGVGKFGIILDVMAQKLYWGDGTSTYKNETNMSLIPKSLSQSLIAVNAQMYRNNVGGLADLSQKSLGVRAIGSAGITYARLLDGKIWGYFSALAPWDYAAGAILLQPFGYLTCQLDGRKLDFKSRQMMMTIPKGQLEEIKNDLRILKSEAFT